MLSKAGVTLGSIYDEDVNRTVEQRLCGEMCQISQRKTEAHNEYMNEMYDETTPNSYINYSDADNLHGLATCHKLPYKDFELIDYKMELNEIMEYDDLGIGKE